MSKPISVGDLVMVIRPMPCGHGTPGYVFKVGELIPTRTGTVQCLHCNREHREGDMLAIPVGSSDTGKDAQSVALWRVKRIPPLDELEGEEQKEDMREPA